MINLQHPDQPIVILIRGLPGSGKTHIAEALQKTLGETNVVMLDPDTINYDSPEYKAHLKAMAEEGVDPALYPYRFSRAKVFQAIADKKIVIWNQPFSNLGMFHRMVDKFLGQAVKHHAELTLLVVEVEIDHAIAKSRIDDRIKKGGHGPSADTFQRFINDHRSFAGEGFDTVTVYGDDDPAKSVTKIIEHLKNL